MAFEYGDKIEKMDADKLAAYIDYLCNDAPLVMLNDMARELYQLKQSESPDFDELMYEAIMRGITNKTRRA